MTARRALTLLALLLTLAPARVALADVGDYLGKPVASVTLRSDGRVLTEPRLLSLVETPVGQPLDMHAVRESMTHLFSLGVYADVRVEATLAADGVRLVYELVPLHPVEEVLFIGAQGAGIDEGRLRQLLDERFGRSPRSTSAVAMAQVVEQALRDAGYLRARVTPRADVQREAERTVLVFTVEPGVRARIGEITIEGNPGVPMAEFRAQLDLKAGDPYVREVVNARVDRYLTDRRRRGFYQARLAVLPRLDSEERTARLLVSVDQGPRVRVVFAGDPVPVDRRDELVPIAREGAVDEDLLEDSSNRIADFFRAQGYRDAVAPFARETQGDELVITFTVKRGGQYRIESVDIAGNASIPDEALAGVLRVRAGQPFSSAALDADLIQIEEAYRRQGFASATADLTIEPHPPAADQHVPVAVRITVTENARTTVNSVSIEGNASVPASELAQGLSLVVGQPFSVARMAFDRDAIELHYANLGYHSAAVESRPRLSEDGRLVDVVFAVREGARVFVDRVLIVGNDRTSTETIERELRFKPGDPLGLEAISESQRRLAALGLFRRARITQLGRSDELRRDVLVAIEEAPLTTVGYGAGFEVRRRVVRTADDPTVASEQLQFAPRASFEVGRRNLFGTNRSVNLFTSASLHPRNSPVFANQAPATGDAGGYGFPQYRVLGQFRQPRILRSTDFRVTGTLEQQIRSSFNFSRRSVIAELAARLSRTVSISGGYQIQRTRVFNQSVEESQQRTIDRLFPKVRVSSFLASAIRDTRDDPVDPSDGEYFSVNGQVAARAIGSEVGFVKSYLTAQSFRILPRTRGVVFAASARLGAAAGFPNAAGSRDLPASERFFAGGDTTVRGFTLDRLGVRRTPPGPADTLDPAGFALGGNALLLFNGEFRVPIRAGVRVVGFADVGNVFKTVPDVNFSDLRPALGFGFRYKSPVGPLRFDLGFKVPRREGEPRTAWFITFGEAF
jgi:outer membrane protein insertion porin family